MLNELRTIPSRCTMRGGGGSSTTGAAFVGASPIAGAGISGVAGGSVGAGATPGVSGIVVGAGAGSVGATATTGASSCFKYIAAMNAYAFAGAWIWVQSPLT